MKIATIIGARPQFIKAAMVTRAVEQSSAVTELLIHTGQHYDKNMSEVFLDELGLPKPAYNLAIGSGNHGSQTGRMMEALENVLAHECPHWVLLYGDTNSTLAGALVASKLHIRCAHVEAGLRSFDRRMPEEINRVVTDHVSDLLFAPTKVAVQNLHHEGIPATKIRQVGDVMFDAVMHFGERAAASSTILERLDVKPGEYVLVTLHRAENTDDHARLNAVVEALKAVSRSVRVIFPVHPRTRSAVGDAYFQRQTTSQLLFISPVPYFDMLMLERNARVIATDSGGMQKEAYFCRVPCVTLRDNTEWVELVESGWNRLADVMNTEAVVSALCSNFVPPVAIENPYGDGQAARKIVAALTETSCADKPVWYGAEPALIAKENEGDDYRPHQ